MEAQAENDPRAPLPAGSRSIWRSKSLTGKGVASMTDEQRSELLEDLMAAQGFKENCVSHDIFDSDQDQFTGLSRLSRLDIADDPDDPDDPDSIEFNEPGSMSNVKYNSACSPSFDSACAMLGIDKSTMRYDLGNNEFIHLKPWQIIACAWMILQEDDPIKGGMLNDACGTGKTLAALTAIYHQTSPFRPMKPTLIVCPPTVIDVWMNEIRQFFGDRFRVFVFFGHSKYPERKWKAPVIAKLEELERAIDKLSSHDSQTGRTIILTSYQTWLRRSCAKIRHGHDEGSQLTSRQKRPRMEYVSMMKNGAFERVVCDQGHQVKNTESGRHQSVALLGASHYWFITATPLWNRPGDLQGYIEILHRPSFDESIRPETSRNLTIEAYRAFENVRFSCDMELPTYLLSPKAVARLAMNPSDWNGLGRFVLPVVMGMISLSRNLGELIDMGPEAEAVVLGGQVPPARIGTVDLRFPPEYQVKHNERYAKYTNSLVKVNDNSITNKPPLRAMRTRLGFPNLTDEQMARLLAFSPRLHDFVEAGKKEDIDLDAAVKSLAISFREYWERTVQDKTSTMPSCGYDIAQYLAEDSPKLRYLLQIFSDEGLLPNPAASGAPRFIIFCINPRVRWLVEMFVTALGIGFSAIRLGTQAHEKFKISADFTNPRSSARVLLSTFQCASQGLNLHRCCSRVIVLQTPRNLSTLVQAIGRVHRLGQTEEQKAWIFFQNHTIERWAEYSLTRKALPALVAEIEARIEGFQEQEAPESKEREGMIMTMAADEICRMLGQSESRLKYNNPHDLGDPRFDRQQTGSLYSETSSEGDLTKKHMSDIEFEGYQDVMDRASDIMTSTTTRELAETDTPEGNGQ